MEIRFNIEKNERKALAKKIAELVGEDAKYLGVPSCAYQIAFFTLSKDSVLSFSDRSDTEIVETVLDGLAKAGYEGENISGECTETDDEKAEIEEGYVEIDVTIVSDTDTEEPETEPLSASISFPLDDHTVNSLTNLICMIHSRGALLSKATGGNFHASMELIDKISNNNFHSTDVLIAFIKLHDGVSPLTGISFTGDKVIFDGFGEADADHVQTFTKLAAAMNKMALAQKRVQAKDVDDSNEKYALRTWLIRLGLNGAEFKADRKHLMANLSGHTAFRSDEERERWEAKQKAKRDAQKAEQTEDTNEEDNSDAVSE